MEEDANSIAQLHEQLAALTRINQNLQAEIRERQENEAVLQKQVRQMRMFVEQIPVAVAMFDRQAGRVLAGDRWRDTFDSSTPNSIGRSMTQIFPKAGECWVELHQRCLNRGDEVRDEWNVCSADGTIEWYERILCPWYDETGEIGGTIAIAKIVTPHKKIEEQLRESQQLFQLVMDNIPQLIMWKDRQSIYQGCNLSTARIAGFKRSEDIVGKTDYDLPWTTEEADWYRSCDRQVMDSGQSLLHIIETQQQADGKQAWLDTNKIPLRDANGDVVGILLTIEEITERKQAEAALRQLNEELEMRVEARTEKLRKVVTELKRESRDRRRIEQQLRRSEARLQRLADNIPGVIHEFRIESNGRRFFSFLSSGARDLFELESEVLMEDATPGFDRIHPEDLPGFQAQIERSVRHLETLESEFRYMAPSGQKWFRVLARPERQPGGEVILYGCTFDITDRLWIEEQLRTSEARLQRLADNIPGTIYEFHLAPDGKMCFPYVSSGFQDIFNAEPEAAKQDATSAFECIYPEDMGDLQEAIERSAQSLENWKYEWRTISGSGQIKWLKGLAKPELQTDGSILWYGCIVDVTDRKQAEALLASQRQRVSWLVEQSPLAIIEWNPKFEVQAWNQAAQTMFGYHRDEALGRLGVELIVPESAEAGVVEVITQLLNRTGGNYTVNKNLTKDGRCIICEWHNQLLIDGEGKTVGVFSMVLDITERCRIEEQLRASEARLQRLADNIPGTIYEFRMAPNGDRSFSFMSSGARDVFELEPDVLLQDAQPAFDRVHREDLPCLYAELERSASTLDNFESELRLLVPSGQKWIRILARPERQSGGEILWYGSISDISDRKHAEAELAKLSLVASQTDSAVVITDRDGLTEWVNDSFVRITGYTLDEVRGKKPGSLLQGPLTDSETVDRIREAIRTQTPFQGEILNYDKQGRSYWLWLSINPIFDSTGALSQFVAIESDITTRKQYELQLKQQTEELEKTLSELKRTQVQLVQSEKMSSLGQLVAGIAHEINNPVNFIFGNLSYVKEYTEDLLAAIDIYQTHYPDPPPEVQEKLDLDEIEFLQADLTKLLQSMRVGADRIREIVLSLRTFSRLDEADVKEVDIHDGIESTLTILQNRFKANSVPVAGTEYQRRAIEIVKDYGKLPLVECYSGPLNQVFMNILANAIDALDERDRTCTPEEIQQNPSTIRIATEADDALDRVTIRIVDNGPGIPEEIQNRIFDPFFTTKAIGKGTGLGMSISYQIVTEKHQGSLECISQLGVGTEFAIEIPVRSSSGKEE